VDQPQPVHGDQDGVAFELRPEWLAGRYWWRVYVAGHPKVLVRHREHGLAAARALAADEAQFRAETDGA
jgi:hypothetical protein